MASVAGIGHNNGPTMEGGTAWRRHCWSAARAALLPTLPIEVVRQRVRRAAEIGLDYRTYASIRAASGHDVIAFLFSTNALRLLAPAPALPVDRCVRLEAVAGAGRLALVQAPLAADQVAVLTAGLIDHAAPAPRPFDGWSEIRTLLRAALTGAGGTGPRWPAPGVVLVGDTGSEREWAAAGKLGGYLPAERFFAA